MQTGTSSPHARWHCWLW